MKIAFRLAVGLESSSKERQLSADHSNRRLEAVAHARAYYPPRWPLLICAVEATRHLPSCMTTGAAACGVAAVSRTGAHQWVAPRARGGIAIAILIMVFRWGAARLGAWKAAKRGGSRMHGRNLISPDPGAGFLSSASALRIANLAKINCGDTEDIY